MADLPDLEVCQGLPGLPSGRPPSRVALRVLMPYKKPTMTTPYHSRYYALELRRRGAAGTVDGVGTALFDARVDLNPHQIEAALFALAPLRGPAPQEAGRLLADEVGLGKTIEAGLVLCQLWAERRRRLLVVCPAALRKQWCQELESKFGLRTRLLEGRRHEGNPFEVDAVAVCSYPFARNQLARLAEVSWDLVVCDEAHRLRNAWKQDSRLARPLVDALRRSPRVFLTATPLQNTLLELYGLVTALDERTFADPATFKAQYMKGTPDFGDLRKRLEPVVHRTLRREVLPYVRYTERRPLTQRFTSSPEEQRLYRDISDYLARDELQALPRAQRGLATMVLRKLLASSSAAIASGLDTLRRRLEAQLDHDGPPVDVAATFEDEGFDDAWLDEMLDDEAQADRTDRGAIRREIADLARLSERGRQIPVDQRMHALLTALRAGFQELRRQPGAAEKAVIFTESRITQDRLRTWLEGQGFAGKVVRFNGGGGGDRERAILDDWLRRNPEAGRPVSQGGNTRAVNLRAALVDHFEREATILIATEAGAEGLNLQFCSLVVNYDLPWNPQRVEQRIGRCHRYGQKHDVVVVNFLDEANAADARVLELLQDKFRLFDGVFGASDEILGRIDGGGGFEKRVHAIYRTCRTLDQIADAFDALRAELDEAIAAREEKARAALMDHFDATVHDRLRIELGAAQERLDRVGRMFWSLTRWALEGRATFNATDRAFDLHTPPLSGVAAGRYELVARSGNVVPDSFVYRLTHPLGEHVVERGARALVPAAQLVFDASGARPRVMAAEALRGQRGWLRLDRLVTRSMSDEEHLVFSGCTEDGPTPDPEVLARLFDLSARVEPLTDAVEPAALVSSSERARGAVLAAAAQRAETELTRARERLERWADDQIQAAEVELREIRGQIRQAEREARKAPTVDQQLVLQRRIAELETHQRKARQHVFTVEDEVRAKRGALLDALEARIQQRTEVEGIFTIAWAVE